MVFVGGPRQVGKTTFALSFLQPPSASHPAYLSWDEVRTRQQLLRGELPPDEPLVVLDEIHKFARWRGLLKGWFDTQRDRRRFLVTGSARLDYYRKGGDSLQGRYHYYRLHPLTLPEVDAVGWTAASRGALDHLLAYGGFPEPFVRGDRRFWRRWQRERRDRVLYEDLRDLERVREVSLLDLLAEALPDRVGSPLSIRQLADALQVAHATVARWLEIFERLYLCFRLSPYDGGAPARGGAPTSGDPPMASPRIRAVKKEQKLYLWDWSLVQDPGPRFENLVASHLLKYCHHLEDTQGLRMELRYIRDTDRREVDFVVLADGVPRFAVEAKLGERPPSRALRYFQQRTRIRRFYQVHTGQADYEKDGIRVLPFGTFCAVETLV